MRPTHPKLVEWWDHDHAAAIRDGNIFKVVWSSSRVGFGCAFHPSLEAALAECDSIRERQEIKKPNAFENDPNLEPIFRRVHVEVFRDGAWVEEPRTRSEYVFDYGETPEAKDRKERAQRRRR